MSTENPKDEDNILELAKKAYDKQRYADAKVLYKMFIEECEGSGDVDRQLLIDTFNNLATTCFRLGQYAEAEEFCRRHIQLLKERSKDGDGTGTVSALTTLASIQRRLGNLSESETSIRDALARASQALGKDDAAVGKCWNNLAAILEAQSKFSEAEAAYKEGLRIKKLAFGDDQPEVAMALEYLGIFYGNRNQLADAESHFRQALEVRRKTAGVDSLEVAHCLNNLAYVCLTKKEFAAALELCEEALSIRRKILDRGHPDLHSSERLASQIKIQLKVAQLK